LPLKVNKITAFAEKEEKDLIQKILIERQKGRSVRSVINELAGGDIKLALRYQNKFRTAIKKEPYKIKDASEKIKKENGYDFIGIEIPLSSRAFSDSAINLLKGKIDSLVDKICFFVRKENVELKERIAFLEEENKKLKKIAYEQNFVESAIKGFLGKEEKNILN